MNSGLHYGTAEISTSEFNDELENSICYIACSESELVGTCMVSKRNVHHWYFSGEAAYIHLVAVHPDYQGRKIGQRIIEEALRDIKNKDEYSFVFLTTAEKNFALRGVCNKLGFVPLWFSTYRENNFYSITYGTWMTKIPYSMKFIKIRYMLTKAISKFLFKPGRRIRFL